MMEVSHKLDLLNQEYYFKHDGSADEFVRLLNCYQSPLYFDLKNRYGITEPYALFAHDPTVALIFNPDDSMYSMEPRSNWSALELFDIRVVRGRGEATLREIEAILDQGRIVLFHTHAHRLAFHRHYSAYDYFYQADIHNTMSNHFFTALAHDEEFVYYTDGPWMLRMEDFVPYKDSKCIGKVTKKDLLNAGECFLDYFTFEPRMDKIREALSFEGILKLLERIRDSAYLQPETIEGRRHEYNVPALRRLAELCGSGELQLETRAQLYDLNICRLLEWKFETVRQRKFLMQKVMEKEALFQTEPCPELLRIWGQNNQAWLLLLGKLRKMMASGKYTAAVELAPSLEKMAESEETLHRVLTRTLEVLKRE